LGERRKVKLDKGILADSEEKIHYLWKDVLKRGKGVKVNTQYAAPVENISGQLEKSNT
jgi:hypothetical protein